MRDDTHLALAATGLAAVVLAVVECIDPCGVVDTTLSYSVGVAIDECAAKIHRTAGMPVRGKVSAALAGAAEPRVPAAIVPARIEAAAQRVRGDCFGLMSRADGTATRSLWLGRLRPIATHVRLVEESAQ